MPRGLVVEAALVAPDLEVSEVVIVGVNLMSVVVDPGGVGVALEEHIASGENVKGSSRAQPAPLGAAFPGLFPQLVTLGSHYSVCKFRTSRR